MAFLLKDSKSKSAGKNTKALNSDEAKDSNIVVSKLMPRYDGCWWDPPSKNWIGPYMQEDFLQDLKALGASEKKERLKSLLKDKSWVCQLTPSNRSVCRRCGEHIERKTFRVGYPIKDNRGDYYSISNWLHLTCASHAFYHEPYLCRHISDQSPYFVKKSKDGVESTRPIIIKELLETEMVNYSSFTEAEKQSICDKLQPTLEDVNDDEDVDESSDESSLTKPRLPGNLKAVSMLKFQEEGLYWLKSREDDLQVNGGILADEMGMGKTIQMISLIVEQKLSPTLVVCPTAAVLQWRNEILRFTDDIDVRVYHGTNRKNVLDDLPKFNEKDVSHEPGEEKIVVILTTYQTMEYDYRQLSNLKKVACKYCRKYFLPEKLRVHLKYYCGPNAELTEKQKKTERKNNAVKMMTIGGQETMVELTTISR